MIRRFFFGMLMGIADLIPGISGGSVAYFLGIYDDLIAAIKSLKFSTLRDVHWSFIIPLGGGILTSLLLFSRAVAYLLFFQKTGFYAFLFGIIIAVCLQSYLSLERKRFTPFLLGIAFAFLFSHLHMSISHSYLGIFVSAMLAAMAMLLPGISGSYLLHLLGAYRVIIEALATPLELKSLSTLAMAALGITCGVFLFSRLIASFLMKHKEGMHALLVGLMVGSLPMLWPFSGKGIILPLILAGFGFMILILMTLRFKKSIV